MEERKHTSRATLNTTQRRVSNITWKHMKQTTHTTHARIKPIEEQYYEENSGNSRKLKPPKNMITNNKYKVDTADTNNATHDETYDKCRTRKKMRTMHTQPQIKHIHNNKYNQWNNGGHAETVVNKEIQDSDAHTTQQARHTCDGPTVWRHACKDKRRGPVAWWAPLNTHQHYNLNLRVEGRASQRPLNKITQ